MFLCGFKNGEPHSHIAFRWLVAKGFEKLDGLRDSIWKITNLSILLRVYIRDTYLDSKSRKTMFSMFLCGFKKGVTTNQMELEKALAVSLQLYA